MWKGLYILSRKKSPILFEDVNWVVFKSFWWKKNHEKSFCIIHGCKQAIQCCIDFSRKCENFFFAAAIQFRLFPNSKPTQKSPFSSDIN
jgi:hypothetical protein